jgi:hypothetical protein
MTMSFSSPESRSFPWSRFQPYSYKGMASRTDHSLISGFGDDPSLRSSIFLAMSNSFHFDILTGAPAGSPHYWVVPDSVTGVRPPAVFENIPSDLQGGIFVGA